MKAVLGEDLACELYMAIVRSGIDVLDSSKRRYDELAAAIGFGYGAAHADVLTRAKCLNEAYARSGADHRGDQPTSLDELERRIMSTITHAIVNEDGVLEGKAGPVPDGALKATPIERKPGCFRLEGSGAIIPIRFRVDTLEVTTERVGAVPGGTIKCAVQLGNTVVMFKCDVGLYPLEMKEAMELREFPSLLSKQLLPFPVWCQPREYALADKLHAAVRQGGGTGRMRDFYDMAVMIQSGSLDTAVAATALQKTFALYGTQRYGSDMPCSVDEIEALSSDFVEDHAADWDKMRSTHGWAVPMPNFATVISSIRDFVQPVLDIANPSIGVAA